MNSHTELYRPVLVMAPGVLAGAEKVVLTGLVGLKKLGLNPLMVIIRETRVPHLAKDFQKALPANIESVVIDSTKALDIHLPKRLRHVLSQEKLPLILHSHGFKALIACYMAKGAHAHLHTHHGNTGHTFKVRVYERIALMAMKTCDTVIAVSSKMKKELEKSLLPYQKITIVENMLSLENASSLRLQRMGKGRTAGTINLLYVGRLSPEKGALTFVKHLASFPQREKFHLTILGDGVEKKQIEDLMASQHLESQVVLHGFVKDPSPHFISADVLIMPSLREGLPMTLIEALASGMPVIANDVGAIASLLTHGKNGSFANDDSEASWHELLELTLKHWREWEKEALLSSESIEERFSLGHWAKKTKKLYEEVFKS